MIVYKHNHRYSSDGIVFGNWQGLWPWLVGHMFTPRFWKSVRVDGLLLTITRGHRAVMNTHSVGGNSERAKYVGMDQYGNKYYEDFDAARNMGDYFRLQSAQVG